MCLHLTTREVRSYKGQGSDGYPSRIEVSIIGLLLLGECGRLFKEGISELAHVV